MITIRYFLNGEEEGTLHKEEFESQEQVDSFLKNFGGAIEVFSIQ